MKDAMRSLFRRVPLGVQLLVVVIVVLPVCYLAGVVVDRATPHGGVRKVPVEEELDGCTLLVASKLYDGPSSSAPKSTYTVDPKNVRCERVDESWYWVLTTHDFPSGNRGGSYTREVSGYVQASYLRPYWPIGSVPPSLTPTPCFPAGDGDCRPTR